MFLPFFHALRDHGVPVTLREFLDFLGALQAGLARYDIEAFYYLARGTLVKNERHIDRFDRAFSHSFEGVEQISTEALLDELTARQLPREWLERLAEKMLGAAERAKAEAAGGFEALMDLLRQRLAEQNKRHQGGSKWIGTGGTSPFGAYGFNPEGVRIGRDGPGEGRAVKVWDRREYRDFDDQVELGTRGIKMALKRLRQWARDGAHEELDLHGTIRATAEQGWLDVKTRPERHNAVKVLLFLDVGGSMDPYIRHMEELFSAARAEFKHLEYYYFHNCLYEGVWRDNRRRWTEQVSTWDVIHRFGADYKCIFIGDASMSPYEIASPGGAVEHWNKEAGAVWLERAAEKWPDHIWINPVEERYWQHMPSTEMIAEIWGADRMFPLTLAGIESAMKRLGP